MHGGYCPLIVLYALLPLPKAYLRSTIFAARPLLLADLPHKKYPTLGRTQLLPPGSISHAVTVKVFALARLISHRLSSSHARVITSGGCVHFVACQISEWSHRTDLVHANSQIRTRLPPPSQVHSSGGRHTTETDVPQSVDITLEWVKNVAIAGCFGVLALVELWVPIQEMADRWAGGGPLATTLPLTGYLGALFLVVVIPVGAVCCGELRKRFWLWWTSHRHMD